MFIAFGIFSAKFCLADKFAKHYFLLSSSMHLGHGQLICEVNNVKVIYFISTCRSNVKIRIKLKEK